MATEATDLTVSPNLANVPRVDFVEDVDSFMKQPGNDTAEVVLKKQEELHNKFKFMEYNLNLKKTRLKNQVPDIKSSLDIVKHLMVKKDKTESMSTKFLLSDNVYAKAIVPPTDKVCLWLGANVMLEYEINEADDVLMKNLEAAKKSLSQVEDDLLYIRDQMTTLEVNMARVYNWDVNRRKEEKEAKS
ncbi:prefoldin subunit 3 [Plakobranchus ocellatus]|uniref:Prefoldin subunit 3 n=1 Tax=Plakobranchus ocellatus TaxID=259542 RepID=A0AAV3YRM5_9GAST|nr:prefoldin subunit 3 [Plakobranchus ocellatus]